MTSWRPAETYVIDPRQLGFLESPTTILRHESEVRGYLQAATRRVRIFSGEANCLIYSRRGILEAFRTASSDGVEIEMILGPTVSIWNDGEAPAILDLVLDGVIRLYVRSTRGKHGHYFIADEQRAWVQEYHTTLAPLSLRESILVEGHSAVEGLLGHFQRELDTAESVSDPAGALVSLTPLQAEWIREHAADPDMMTRSDFERALEAYRAHEERLRRVVSGIAERFAATSR